jgi:hypothetical protein
MHSRLEMGVNTEGYKQEFQISKQYISKALVETSQLIGKP